MASTVEIAALFNDLLFIKLRDNKRAFVLRAKESFQQGCLSRDDVRSLMQLKSTYSVQIRALQEARQRARNTAGRRASGLTMQDVEAIQAERERERREQLTDFGF